jgi:hypothetical protein
MDYKILYPSTFRVVLRILEPRNFKALRQNFNFYKSVEALMGNGDQELQQRWFYDPKEVY